MEFLEILRKFRCEVNWRKYIYIYAYTCIDYVCVKCVRNFYAVILAWIHVYIIIHKIVYVNSCNKLVNEYIL